MGLRHHRQDHNGTPPHPPTTSAMNEMEKKQTVRVPLPCQNSGPGGGVGPWTRGFMKAHKATGSMGGRLQRESDAAARQHGRARRMVGRHRAAPGGRRPAEGSRVHTVAVGWRRRRQFLGDLLHHRRDPGPHLTRVSPRPKETIPGLKGGSFDAILRFFLQKKSEYLPFSRE